MHLLEVQETGPGLEAGLRARQGKDDGAHAPRFGGRCSDVPPVMPTASPWTAQRGLCPAPPPLSGDPGTLSWRSRQKGRGWVGVVWGGVPCEIFRN